MSIYTPYFYVIQDTRNGMYYAGAKWAQDADPTQFMVEGGYVTSSKIIKEIIEECGINVFRIVRLKEMETPLSHETKFLQKVDAKNNPLFYNQHNGNGDFTNKKMTETSKTKISKAREGMEFSREHKENLSKAAKNRKSSKQRSLESREKSRKALLGREITWNDKISKTLKGRKESDETRKKKSDTAKGKLKSNSARENMKKAQKRLAEQNKKTGTTLKWYTNGIDNIRCLEGAEPIGFKRGRYIPRRNS